jgi:hypothetical protein
MRKAFYFFGLLILFYSCNIKKEPVFIKIDNLKLVSFKSDTIRLKANAFFQNPNDVGGKIATDEIKVIINGTEVAKISSEEFKVPARKDFTIPLQVAIPAKKVFDDSKGGFLGGLLNSVLKKSVKVQFKGDLKYKVFGYSSNYPVDITQDLKIKF